MISSCEFENGLWLQEVSKGFELRSLSEIEVTHYMIHSYMGSLLLHSYFQFLFKNHKKSHDFVDYYLTQFCKIY